jgi:hypothetical protein
MIDLNYVALVLQQAQQALEAADAGIRTHVPQKYSRRILGANHLGHMAEIVNRCRQEVVNEVLGLNTGEPPAVIEGFPVGGMEPESPAEPSDDPPEGAHVEHCGTVTLDELDRIFDA